MMPFPSAYPCESVFIRGFYYMVTDKPEVSG
jgi:hypothetical protein